MASYKKAVKELRIGKKIFLANVDRDGVNDGVTKQIVDDWKKIMPQFPDFLLTEGYFPEATLVKKGDGVVITVHYIANFQGVPNKEETLEIAENQAVELLSHFVKSPKSTFEAFGDGWSYF